MRIADIEIRLCALPESPMDNSEMRGGARSALEFLVITMRTDEGLRASSLGFAGRGAKMAGEIAAAALKPFFLGRDPHYRERHWHEYRMADRWWNHIPIYSYGPFDIVCWLLSSQAAGLPLYRFLGATRDVVPLYGSSLLLPSPEHYAEQARAVQRLGWKGYKVHPPGDPAVDLEIYRACRQAVGPDFRLMSDPVAAYTFEQALRIGRELEKLGYYWFEEPLFDESHHGLRELARTLDIPICGAEVLSKHPYSVAEAISTRVYDIVRADPSWSGGITGVMKTAHLAEAFGVQCELHTTIYHPLELVNLHCCAALHNCEMFELLLPMSHYSFGLAEPIRIENGCAVLPDGPGLGIDLDWNMIDNSTYGVL
jgi:L-alanine-DL-glutamate epimerase-like enolase superfamily enzyme